MGTAQRELGELDKARASLTKACELEPSSVYFLHCLVDVTPVVAGDGMLERLQSLQSGCSTSDTLNQARLHFSLGKAWADIGDNERSFFHFLEGNRYKRAEIDYDEGTTLGAMAETARAFSPALLRSLKRNGNPSRTPIFVVGMPRSGSTLVEQVLAANHRVLALGELRAFEDIVRSFDSMKGSAFPGWLTTLEPDDLSELAQRYLTRIEAVARAHDPAFDIGGETRVLDKMPGNFKFLGLIHLAFPNARIIHTRRDPVETCLSCFRILFESVPFSYDLGELGRCYRQYERLMAAWRQTLPREVIYDVDYERLVFDFETEARRLVSYCGLEWDDACLSFHNVRRPVRTASSTQVRLPLYSTSVRKWQPANEVIQPLLDGLAAE
jgi:hypothetical protein